MRIEARIEIKVVMMAMKMEKDIIILNINIMITMMTIIKTMKQIKCQQKLKNNKSMCMNYRNKHSSSYNKGKKKIKNLRKKSQKMEIKI